MSTVNNSINYTGANTFVIPWMSWDYFVFANGNVAWSQSTSLNGDPYTGPSQDYGTVPLIIPQSGVYRFCMTLVQYLNQAITTFVINGVTTNIDGYNTGTNSMSYAWEQTLTAGTYDIDLNNLTKNALSTDYQMLLQGDGLLVTYMGPSGP